MSKSGNLVGPWRQIHGAIWLIGLAILFWRGWWWPGLLVLVAISAIAEAVIQIAVPSAVAPEQEIQPETASDDKVPEEPLVGAAPITEARHPELLPSECAKCGAPVRANEVLWTSDHSADCPYCGVNLPMRRA